MFQKEFLLISGDRLTNIPKDCTTNNLPKIYFDLYKQTAKILNNQTFLTQQIRHELIKKISMSYQKVLALSEKQSFFRNKSLILAADDLRNKFIELLITDEYEKQFLIGNNNLNPIDICYQLAELNLNEYKPKKIEMAYLTMKKLSLINLNIAHSIG
jgi:hypothetical protein